MIIMTMNLYLTTSLFPSLTSHHPPCLSTPPDWGVLCRFIPRQMASNSRYPPREPHEEVLDTARLPELQGGACAKKKGDQIDSYITRIPALTHGVAQSKWNAARGGSAGGARDGEWAKARARKGRGADTRRADFSQISSHLCDKKGK